MLRRDAFALAEERYGEPPFLGSSSPCSSCRLTRIPSRNRAAEYKPILEEVESILMEAGLDEEEMKKSAAAGGKGNVGQSRNRR